MNKAFKKYMMTQTAKGDREYRNEPRQKDMRMGGYESRYEPRQGGYGMNYPRYENEPEDRFRDRRGREHYDNGRFAPMRNAMDEPDMRHYPPVYDQPEDRYYEPNSALPRMGFDMTEQHDQPKIWKSGMAKSNPMHDRYEDLTEEKANRWLNQMQNEDGSKGPHWTLDQVKQVVKQKMLPYDDISLWLALNLVWSDFYPAAKKFNVNNTEFYIEMAKSFLDDKDAKPNKLENYFECVVK